MEKTYLSSPYPKSRAYSPAVVTSGAQRHIWLAGHTGHLADDGRSLANDFDAQARQVFRNMERTLAEVGASLSDVVSMTVCVTDRSNTPRVADIRKEFYRDDYPASATLTVAGLPDPAMMIEIQAIAVIAA
jgi:2-iminobutanoate/2-iminopropanoate deaminase